MSDLDNIFKALRLVPDFDGNPNILTRFIRLCDQLVAQYAQEGNDLCNLGLLNGILNKVVGPAARMINANGIPNDWIGIRNALINNFADQRDETALYNDLALLTQGPSTPQEFYERCQNLFSTIMTYISLHDSLQTTIDAKRDLYKKLTLQAYLRGLKDPLGSRIRCMRPESIEKALEFVHEEMNTLYMQGRNEHLHDKRPQTLPNQFSQNFKIPMQPTMQSPPFKFSMPNAPGPSRPHQPPVMYRPPPQLRPPMGMNQPRMPSRTQQMFGAHPQGYNPRSGAFRLQPREFNTPQGPKPMSGVSHFVTKPTFGTNSWNWARQGNPPPSNYFKQRDVNMNVCSTYDDYNNYADSYEYDYNEPNYCDEYYVTDFNDYDYTVTDITDNDPTIQTSDDQAQPSTSQDFPTDSKLKKSK